MTCRRGPLEVGQTFNEWARLYDNVVNFTENPPPYSKMIFHQYIEVFMGLPKHKRYTVGWYPEKYEPEVEKHYSSMYDSVYARRLFPDLKFVLLRRDPISHAISLYFARTSKTYHIYDKDVLNSYLSRQIEIDDGRLMEAYLDAVLYQDSWRHFLSGDELLHEVDYETLVREPEATLTKLYQFLGIRPESVVKSMEAVHGEEKKIHRMTRPEAEAVTERLKILLKVKCC
jgi:hypothetical protein